MVRNKQVYLSKLYINHNYLLSRYSFEFIYQKEKKGITQKKKSKYLVSVSG